ncbi:cilia- and flagella-associated protein 161 [Suricata suricatta]|uniref:cilia- and flagella-associated protein 161 n=1 Tax=Suricata suricatta TaxID=37032 RepID=UPI001155A069|nr:cilia- and flagella-associated protein 161 [Suricata suricatta]
MTAKRRPQTIVSEDTNAATRRAPGKRGSHTAALAAAGTLKINGRLPAEAAELGRRPGGRSGLGASRLVRSLPRSIRLYRLRGSEATVRELMKDFLEKRDKGQLLIQRNRRLKENLLRPMPLSVAEDGYVHCGHRVMLVNPAPAEPEAPRSLGGDLSLCMTPDEIRAHLSDELEVPCGLSAAQTKVPVGRNTFIILSADGDATGRVLRFGQNFRLAMTGGFEDKTLYLSSDHRTLLKSSRRSRLQEVYLTDEVSYLNCWQAAFLDPQLRLEHEGAPVPPLIFLIGETGCRRCLPDQVQ